MSSTCCQSSYTLTDYRTTKLNIWIYLKSPQQGCEELPESTTWSYLRWRHNLWVLRCLLLPKSVLNTTPKTCNNAHTVKMSPFRGKLKNWYFESMLINTFLKLNWTELTWLCFYENIILTHYFTYSFNNALNLL